jgi:hypothetical protein
MPSLGRDLSVPRTWFLCVRLLEAGVLVLLAGVTLEVWDAFRASSQGVGPFYNDPSAAPDHMTLMQRLMSFTFYGGIFQGPVMLVLAACLLAAGVAVLHLATPVSNARLLRWELLVGWAVAALFVVLRIVTTGVAMFGHDPNRSDDPNIVSYGYQGPSLVEQGLAILVWPVAAGAVLAVAGLWWLRLPAEFDEPEEDQAQREARRLAAERKALTHRPAPSADLDDIVLDGVEQIDPVERLEPRRGSFGDGSTPSGYDDYFRRF